MHDQVPSSSANNYTFSRKGRGKNSEKYESRR
jgi:hypothetical protein